MMALATMESAKTWFQSPKPRFEVPRTIHARPQTALCVELHEGNPDLKHTVMSSVELGDTIALEVTAEGANTGPLRLPAGEVPATGKAWRLPACVMFRVQDGVFKSYHIYLDMADFLAQIGLMPEGVTA
jgi:hypothetical protein